MNADELSRLAGGSRDRVGEPALRAALTGEGGLTFTRSEAEERFLDLVRRADLPTASVNPCPGPYEVDFYWPAERLVVEVDGLAYHGSRGSFESDRLRDAELTVRA